jgi:hypothetical protein
VARVTHPTKRRRVAAATAAAVAVAAAAAVVFQTLVRADSRTPAPPPVLAASAVPYLPSTTAPVTAHDLAADANIASLSDTISHLGFVVGAQRTFQGQSKHRLQLVISRTLRFTTAAGARGFVRFVRRHAGDYVGQVPTVKPLRSGGRPGSLIVAPLCACHMAQPALLALVSSGRDVTWLEINGPGATPATLAALLARAP